MSSENLAAEIIARAQERSLRIVTAESCTAGAVAMTLSRVPGAGTVLQGGFITYTKEMKTRLLGVPSILLANQTAVSADVAEAMATGAVERSGADFGAAVTGVAGPNRDEDGNPVGLVYCATFSLCAGAETARYHFDGLSSHEVVAASIRAALQLLRKSMLAD
jgi:nicotinamide-nucleotide amidase